MNKKDGSIGGKLNKEWNINARDFHYHKDGTWFNLLKEFPGALIDNNGYILFNDEKSYLNCGELKRGDRININAGISSLEGYKIEIPFDLSDYCGDPEGRKGARNHAKIERSSKLVKMAKKKWKEENLLCCSVCDFSFSITYIIEDDFIEAHHIIPLSTLKKESKTKISDLAPICSNCHRIIHKIKPMPTIQEFKNNYLRK